MVELRKVLDQLIRILTALLRSGESSDVQNLISEIGETRGKIESLSGEMEASPLKATVMHLLANVDVVTVIYGNDGVREYRRRYVTMCLSAAYAVRGLTLLPH